MIFSTLNQLNCFLLFIFFGLIFGFFYNLAGILFLKKYQKIFQKIIFDSVFFGFFSIFYVFLINFYNFGIFSITLILGYLIGFLWIKNLGKNLVVFLQEKWYTFLIKRKRNGRGKKNKAS